MPLIVCTIFFAILFLCEAIWFDSRKDAEMMKLRRYEEVEYPSRRKTSYLDWL